jgi:hypothetical protein
MSGSVSGAAARKTRNAAHIPPKSDGAGGVALERGVLGAMQAILNSAKVNVDQR